MAEFVLKNNYFEFNEKVKKQISGTAIGTKFAPPYACTFMDTVETEFLKTQRHKPLVWFVTLMMSSLFGLMVKKRSTYFWKI